MALDSDPGEISSILALFHGGIAAFGVVAGAVLAAAYSFFKNYRHEAEERRERKNDTAEMRDARLYAAIAAERDRLAVALAREEASGNRWYRQARAYYGDLCDMRALLVASRASANEWLREGKPWPITWSEPVPPVPPFNVAEDED